MNHRAPDKRGALVLFSGGQDSTTCLAWALERHAHVETIGFEYGQRHAIEMTCRAPIRDAMRALSAGWDARLGDDHLVDASVISAVGSTALTSDAAIEFDAEGLPTTFVPGRNLLFLTLAAAVATRRRLTVLVGGMCETDYSGYPDCRDDAVKAMQLALNAGMKVGPNAGPGARFVIDTPLMWIDKAATWKLAQELGGAAFIDLIRDRTHTCYLGDRETAHRWGRGCGTCLACVLRAKGYDAYREASLQGDRR